MNRWMCTTLIAVLAAGTAGCEDLLFEDRDKTYTGPAFVEFAPVMPTGVYSMAVSFSAGSATTTTATVGVQYVSAPPDAAVSGQFKTGAGTTAVDGQHYTLPAGNSYTIPAGQNAVDIQVDFLGPGLADGESVTLVLELLDGTGFTASPNYKTFTITATKGS